jgi:hypothetical protein
MVAATALAAACGGDFTSSEGSGGSGAASSSSSSSASSSSSTGEGGEGGSSSSSSSSSSGTGGGCPDQSGDCQTNDQCLNGDCVELSPCGFKVCERPLDEADSCSGGGNDECCNTSQCVNDGTCYLGPFAPTCGGAVELPHNVCAVEGCQDAGDCPAPQAGMSMICAPANTLGYPVSHCLAASCLTNAECTDEPGGHCATVTPSCCSGPNVLLCTYPSDGCRSDTNCPGGHCAQDGTRARCFDGAPACPP